MIQRLTKTGTLARDDIKKKKGREDSEGKGNGGTKPKFILVDLLRYAVSLPVAK